MGAFIRWPRIFSGYGLEAAISDGGKRLLRVFILLSVRWPWRLASSRHWIINRF